MFGSIRGKILVKGDRSAVIETSSGVGYKINILPGLASRLKTNEEKFFWTYTHVREDILDLYGFSETEELELFELLLSVSGIGPKGALNILSLASIETLIHAISSGDTAYLTKISGIGKKTAEKIILELKDKFANKANGGNSPLREELDALEALKSLGYSQYEAREALKKCSPSHDINGKIKEALKILSKNHA